jgi:lysophospholipase L1-like esterase
MTRINSFSRIAAAVAVVVLIAVPGFAQRGEADFTRFVALGDSYGAGVSNGSVNERHQVHSWPAIIARQAGADVFVQPLVSYPGIGPEIELVDVVSFPPRFATSPVSGNPINLTYPRAYNNLSIPGANVQALTTLTGAEQNPVGTAAQTARFILRGQGTAVQQALSLDPTFIAIWIGGNDLLGAVLSGTPNNLTSVESFRTAYNTMLDQLTTGAPNAGMIVGNLPTTPAALPLLTTVPPVLINPQTRQPVLGPDGQPIFFIADLGGGQIGQLPPGSVVLLPASARLATGVGIPPAFRNIPPFNLLPNVGTPLTDAEVLTPTEQQAIAARAVAYNEVIAQAASARDIPVADIKGLFDRFASPTGYRVGPFTFTSQYVQGGIFSFDGFHLTDIGYMFFANEYIRTINDAYDEEIPVAGLSQFFANNGAFPTTSSGAPLFENMEWDMDESAAQSILKFATPARARRLRAAH